MNGETNQNDSVTSFEERKENSRNERKFSKNIYINPSSSQSTKHTMHITSKKPFPTNYVVNSKSTSPLISTPMRSKPNFFKTQAKQLPKVKIRSSSIIKRPRENRDVTEKRRTKCFSLSALYDNYLNFSNEEIPEKNYVSKNECKFRKIYKYDKLYTKKQKEIKSNNEIAYRSDFNIEKYHDMLLHFTGIKARRELIIKMRQDLVDLRRVVDTSKGNYKFKQRNRWDLLAERIENFVPHFLITKINDLSQTKLNEIAKRNNKINLINRKYSYNKM